MTAETLKPFIKSPLASDLHKEKGSKGVIVCYSIILAVFYVGLLGFVVWNSIRVANLQNEVNHLNLLIDNIQKRLGLDLLADLDAFEEAYAHRGATGKQDKENEFFNFPNDDYSLDESVDSFEDDYRSDMNDDEEDEDEYGSGIKDESTDSNYEKLKHDLQDIMYRDLQSEEDLSFSEESLKDKFRKTRAVSSRSGVPVIEQPYPVQNKTDNISPAQPTMKYDWNEKSTQQHLGRKHKKYMGTRGNQPHYSSNTNHVQQGNIGSRPDPIGGQVTTKSPETYARPNRVMHTNEDKSQAFRQVITKSEFERMQRHRIVDKSGSDPAQVVLTGTRRRSMRPMHKSLESRSRQGMTRGRSIAVHYNGDTSRYATGHHEHYDGNGRLRHPGGVYTDWVVDPQLAMFGGENFFHMENGVVTIKENGIYLLYAQIFYHDDHDTNGYVIEKNHEAFLQCTAMTHSNQRITKSNTCFTSGVTFMKSGDKIRLVDLGNHRYTLLQPAKSFFGIVKLGDARSGALHHRQSGEESNKHQTSAEMRRLS